MPLPEDPQLLALSNDVIHQFDAIFGLHAGFRPAHAKGVLLTGSFAPSPAARQLSRAPHFERESTPVTARFSNSTGIPVIPDTDPQADPRGLAVRFHLGQHVHTDIVSHSIDAFPTRTGAEFLEMLRAAMSSDPAKPSDPANPSPIERFMAAHPAALAFVQAPKPAPSSFARETYFAVSAFHFTNRSGDTRFARYRIIPEGGNDPLAPALAAKGPDYLFEELSERLSRGPIKFRLAAQLAEGGDVVDDATIRWPENRTVLELGTIQLDRPAPDNAAEQKRIIFDPIPRVEGIEPSADPLFELRAAVYLLSGRRRRSA